MTAQDVLERLSKLYPKKIDLSLGRLQLLLMRLGNPQEKLAPIVHVAGTNGKGSTLAFLTAICQASGLKVHRYISPHLVRFNERIYCAGHDIGDERLVDILSFVEKVNDGAPITFFEATTAAAFLAFSQIEADIVLLETGLGGRFDATNVVNQPMCTAITPISMDHMDFLGNSLGAIAFEKSGIQKTGVDSIVAPQNPEVEKVLQEDAVVRKVPVFLGGRDWKVKEIAGNLHFTFQGKFFLLPKPALKGPHQIINAGTALAVANRLLHHGLPITQTGMELGLVNAHWPARLQKLSKGPLVEALGPTFDIWLDGGHNPGAGQVLGDYFTKQSDKRPLYLAVGMLNTKDVEGFLRPFIPVASKIFTLTMTNQDKSMFAQEIANIAQGLGIKAMALEGGIEDIKTQLPASGRLLIAGSLYLSGAILRTHS